jgi:arylsulfatase
VREGPWKIVRSCGSEPWELYDIDRDRGEEHDLATIHPGVVDRLAAAWLAWADRCGVLPWPLPKDA